MDVSIIVVNWNTKDILSDCLRSIEEQTQGIQYEVIVVDNGSTDGSVDVIRTQFPWVKLMANQDNRGFAAANNQALEVALGRYALLLNSDTVVLDNAIAKSLRFADEHEEAAVVGCRLLNPDHSLQLSCFRYPSILNMLISSSYLHKLFPQSRFFGREQMTMWERDSIQEVDVVTGCFMLVRKQALDEVGLLDEQFFMYGEETDWCYRFKQAGWKVMFAPVGEIIHLHGASSKKKKAEMMLQLRGSILLFIKKHKGRLSHGLACLLVAVFFVIRAPYWLLRALTCGPERQDHFQRAKVYGLGAVQALLGGDGLLVKRKPA